jgi:predicted ATPase
MISSFTVENYRSFPDKITIELRPLTLVFGYNNSGKSALLRFLPLIAESVSPSATAPLSLGGKAARGAQFKDILSQLDASPQITFEISFDTPLGNDPRLEKSKRVVFQLRDLHDRRQQIVQSIYGLDQQDKELFRFDWDLEATQAGRLSNSYTAKMLYSDPVATLEKQLEDTLQLQWNGLVPDPDLSLRGLHNEFHKGLWASILVPLRLKFRDLENNLQWLTSFRAVPKRSNQYPGQPPSRLTPEGENAAEILAYDKLNNGPLLPIVSQWYETHTNQTLDVSEEADRFSVTLGPTKKPLVRVKIADTGEGMAQVLPVLVATALARYKENNLSLLVLEQPELHLHPKIHGALAAHFCELASIENPPKLLVETHSENFLLEVQLQIAKGLLSPDKVLVYWVRQDERGRSSVEKVTFDEMARPQGNWPAGVFHEDIEKAREIILERRKREGL